MNASTRRRSFRAVVATIAGAVMLLLGLGAPAFAATIPDGSTGSITVHKYEQPDTPTGLPNDGSLVDPSLLTALTPIAGVQFTVQQVNTIDLTTNAGWDTYSDLTLPIAAPYTLGPAVTITTDAAGEATAANLPVGVYLVTETVYPAGVTPSAPFLISVPLTNPDDPDSWLYDVHAYPKNSVSGVTKTVTDIADVKIGDDIDWTITADIPDLGNIDGYKIVDQLDTKLTYLSAAVTLTNGTPLVLGTDYTIGFDAGTNTVTVLFTAAGLDKLEANSTAQVQVVITTDVNTVGEIANTALLYPNLASFNVQPGQPGGPVVTPPVLTKWGNVTLHKVGEDTGAALAGATFVIYASQADAEAGTNPIATATTDAAGNITFTGLRYSNWANGVALNPGDPGYRTYYIVETVAPTGYELIPDPIAVIVDDFDNVVDLTIEDVPANGGFELPITGGTGTLLVSGVGIALLAGAGLMAARTRKSR